MKRPAGLDVYPRSLVEVDGSVFFLARSPGGVGEGRVLGVQGDTDGFVGGPGDDVLFCPLAPANAAALRGRLPWLCPAPLGLCTSAGFGDRLGMATPGHVRAARRFDAVAPVFAQQSVRENARTGRTPQEVMADATWGLFQEGWRGPWGADADHLKTPEDVDSFARAGFTFFTVDPGDHVDAEAHTAPLERLKEKVHALPWDGLGDSPEQLHARYLGRRFDVEGFTISFDRLALARAAAKYGRAVAHAARMYRHLAARMAEFELEVSVDETETPTSPEEHYFVASELKRLGVRWISLAPRYAGRFEKGVDFIGDLAEFERALAAHAAIARALGPYKLSIHSGSDKFSIYPLVARLTGGLVHLKTAGTSYLEALRTVARVDARLFAEMLAFARGRYETDRTTYHVSARLDRVPTPDGLDEDGLAGLLDAFDARQVLHVTFGSVLDRFGGRLMAALRAHEEVYHAMLEAHFERHLAPFAG
jgi:hypothetical protein